jgi:hypothetical protein
MAFLFVASQLWRVNAATRNNWPLNQHIRGLPPHGSSPPRSCPRLVLPLVGLHLVYCPPINSRFRTGDLHPTSSRPCRAYRWTRAAIWSGRMVALTRRGLVNAVVRSRSVGSEGNWVARPRDFTGRRTRGASGSADGSRDGPSGRRPAARRNPRCLPASLLGSWPTNDRLESQYSNPRCLHRDL